MSQSDISVAEHRGRNVGLHGFMFVAGLAVANWLSIGCYFIVNPTLQWRLVLGLQGLAPFTLLALRLWLPESPRWLILNRRDTEAYITLFKLHVTKTDTTHALASEEQELIRKQIDLDARHETSWAALSRRPSTRRRLLLGMYMMFLQQSTGQNVLYGFQVNSLTTVDWQPLLVVSFYVTWAAVLNLLGGAVMD